MVRTESLYNADTFVLRGLNVVQVSKRVRVFPERTMKTFRGVGV